MTLFKPPCKMNAQVEKDSDDEVVMDIPEWDEESEEGSEEESDDQAMLESTRHAEEAPRAVANKKK